MPYQRDMILQAFDTGMRPGEVIALKWEGVDFEKNIIHICRSLSDYKNKSDSLI